MERDFKKWYRNFKNTIFKDTINIFKVLDTVLKSIDEKENQKIKVTKINSVEKLEDKLEAISQKKSYERIGKKNVKKWIQFMQEV